jgi:hypothetical protein
LIGKYVNGNCHGLIQLMFQQLVGGNEEDHEKPSVRTAGVDSNLSCTRQKCRRFSHNSFSDGYMEELGNITI